MHLRLSGGHFVILELFPFAMTFLKEPRCDHKPPFIPVQMLKASQAFLPVTPLDISIFTYSSAHFPITYSLIFFSITQATQNPT